MHRTIGYLSKRFAHIRPGEGRKVLLTFSCFFLIIAAYYVIKPVSRALVLGELGSRMVPYVDLVCACVMGPIIALFARLVDRMSKARLVSLAFAAVTAVTLVFWKLLAWHSRWVAGALYIWVSILSVLVVTLFWLVANDLYRPRDAKRLFGFIGSGGILGGIVGSFIAAVGARLIGAEQLPLLSAGLLVVCWALVQSLWRFAPAPVREDDHRTSGTSRQDAFFSDMKGFFGLLGSSRYLFFLVVVVALNKVVSSLAYYQFNPFIERTFTDLNTRTTFTGLFFGSINALAFIIQFFFTSWVLRRGGLLVTLAALPVGLLLGTTGLFLFPVFWLAAGTEMYDAAMNYSLQQTGKEVLYLPIDRSIRYKMKPLIDIVVFRFGKGIAAVIGIVCLDVIGLPVRWLCLVTIPLIGCWLWVAARMRTEYTTTIRTVLQARACSSRTPAESPAAAAGEGEAVNGLGVLTVSRSPAPKLALAGRIIGDSRESASARELLAGLSRYEEPLVAAPLWDNPLELQRLKMTIQNRSHGIGVRRHAVRLLGRQATQDALDYLCGMLIVEEEAALRNEVVRELVKIRLGRRNLPFPTPLIRRQVSREVANYERIVRVGAIYRQHHRGPLAADDPVLALLKVLLEESGEQIFRLLMLLYRPEDIHLVYEQMRAPDQYLRADAIELLDNLVDPAMRAIIFPVLDEDRFLSLFDEPTASRLEPTAAYRLLQEAIWDHNCWLNVTTLCAVGRLQLTSMRQELEKASRHAEPLISTAARVALHFAAVV